MDRNTFYHPQLRFQYPVPSGWKLQNTPMQVQMAPEDGNAVIIFTIAQQKSIEEAAQATTKDLNLEVLDMKQTKANGMDAIAAVSQQVSQNQQNGQEQVIKVLSYFIDYGGKIYVFHGVSAENNFNNYFRTFETTMVNFNQLTDPSKINVNPQRISIKEVKRAATLAEVFNIYDVPQQARNELALLNNRELDDRVERGELIKIISE